MNEHPSANRAYFINLFEYDAWANDRVLELLRTNRSLDDSRCIDLISHVLRSQAIWLGRIQDTDDRNLERWERDTLDVCTDRRKQNTRKWIAMLRSSDGDERARSVTYTNSLGETYSTEVRDIATHVINHGSYHRAQIAQLVRQAGLTPVVTDYIAYARQER